MRVLTLTAVLAAALLGPAASAIAAPGDLDSTFGGSGIRSRASAPRAQPSL